MTLQFSSSSAEIINNQPAETHIQVQQVTHGAYRAGFKRVFDIVLTALSMPLVLPLVALMALLIALDGGNPW